MAEARSSLTMAASAPHSVRQHDGELAHGFAVINDGIGFHVGGGLEFSSAWAAKRYGLHGFGGCVLDDDLIRADIGNHELRAIGALETLAGSGGVAPTGGGVLDERHRIVGAGWHAGDPLARDAGGGVAHLDHGNFHRLAQIEFAVLHAALHAHDC